MDFDTSTPVPALSGERFRVVYRIYGDDAARVAAGIAYEQTVELPAAAVPPGDLEQQIVGQVEAMESDGHAHRVTISYAVETAGDGLTQLLNVIFGNTSMQADIQVLRFELPDSLLKQFKGPRLGVDGLRALLDIPQRPLLCTALKPMGLSPVQLAEVAYRFALGGIDIIKDDHGLANQVFCPFEERVARCAEAVDKANRETGRRSLYVPNITAPVDVIQQRAHYAKDQGAGGLVVSHGLTGPDAMRMIAEDDRIGLPVLAHPALSGSFVASVRNGLSHHALYGQMMRLAGADASIFVSYGGRFPYTQDQCRQVIDGCRVPMGHLKAIFPTPGGGMTLQRMPELRAFYGDDTVFLVAGDLYRDWSRLTESAAAFRQAVET